MLSWVSSVDTAIRLQAGRPRNRSSIPAVTRDFPFSTASVTCYTVGAGMKLTERESEVQNSKGKARPPRHSIQ
jgi:hypothetical protein